MRDRASLEQHARPALFDCAPDGGQSVCRGRASVAGDGVLRSVRSGELGSWGSRRRVDGVFRGSSVCCAPKATNTRARCCGCRRSPERFDGRGVREGVGDDGDDRNM